MRYQDIGVTGIYGPGMILLGVAIDAMEGPLVRLREVDLIARVPSQARAEIGHLAGREDAAVRVNWSGDPEIAAWGVSMGTAPEYGISSEGHPERRDGMITSALFVSAELAESRYETGPVLHLLVRRPGAGEEQRILAGEDRPGAIALGLVSAEGGRSAAVRDAPATGGRRTGRRGPGRPAGALSVLVVAQGSCRAVDADR
ncbi:hypothetical protein ACIOHR_30085 [Streptomyces anulatus]